MRTLPALSPTLWRWDFLPMREASVCPWEGTGSMAVQKLSVYLEAQLPFCSSYNLDFNRRQLFWAELRFTVWLLVANISDLWALSVQTTAISDISGAGVLFLCSSGPAVLFITATKCRVQRVEHAAWWLKASEEETLAQMDLSQLELCRERAFTGE